MNPILIIIILTVYMQIDTKNELDMNKIYKRGFYDFHRCTRKKSRPITSLDVENQHPNINNDQKMQMPTFGNWKNSIQLNKVMQKLLYQHDKPVDKINEMPKSNRKVSSSRQYKHKPLFPKNNQIIKRFIKPDNQPVRYKTLDKSGNKQNNTQDIQGSVKGKKRRFQSLRNSNQMLRQQEPHKNKIISSCTKQITHQNYDSVELTPTDLFIQIPKLNKKNLAKNWFTNIYNRQKANYQGILEKYGIKEKVDDSEFNEFLNQIQ